MPELTKGRLLRSDINAYDGTLLGQRTSSIGGVTQSLKVNDYIDALAVFGNSDESEATEITLGRAITASGSQQRTIKLAPTTWNIRDDKTVPSNVTLWVPAGATLNVSSGKTLTINGPLIRESETWTSGNGTVTHDSTAGLIAPKYTATSGSAARTLADWMDDVDDAAKVFNVTDPAYGATGDGVTDDTAAIQAAIDAAEAAGGGRVVFPDGTYRISDTLIIDSDGVSLEGVGVTASTIDCQDTSGGEDGVRFTDCAWVKMARLNVRTADGHCIKFAGVTWFQVFNVNARDSATGSGFKFEDGVNSTFLGSLYNCRGISNARMGFELSGFHTTLSFFSCQGKSNTLDGWRISDMTYCSWVACAADTNSRYGWLFENLHSSSFVNCGSESNARAGFFGQASSAIASGATVQDVRNVRMEGCFTKNNNSDNQPNEADLLAFSGDTASNNPSEIYVIACESASLASGETDSINVSGDVRVIEDLNESDIAGAIVYRTFSQRKLRRQADNLENPSGVSITGANTPVLSLTDHIGQTDQYGGLVLIEAHNNKWPDGASNSATYFLMVNHASSGTTGVTSIQTAGMTAGSGAAWPSFTWSLDTTNHHLEASPVGSTSGTFRFNIKVMGDLAATFV